MTPQAFPNHREVGIRELHDRLSHYLRVVADGGEVVVTSRGRRVARISAVDSSDPLEDLRKRGLLQEPSRPKSPAAGRARPAPSEPVSDLVADQRR